ncbi:IS4 family transposase [Tepidibacter mesophilus]|uniref:IS4 family transposase n=1 Tax=Tepidibacter mesophilus TaxID=655607 RepID=UPI001FA8FBD6|nr:IS4 family transposase [Tepidibacter mesophilus]
MSKVKTLNMKNTMQQMIQEILKVISKDEIEKIARDVGFIQRQGKLQAWQFLYLCAFSGLDISKNTLVSMSANLNSEIDIEVTTQAIHDRLNDKAVAFLQEIFTRLLNDIALSDSKISTSWDKHFDRIRIVDSTAFQVPEIYKEEYKGSGGSSQPAGVKIQLEYDLKSGKFIHVDVGPGKGNDNTFGSKINETFKERDLSLRDLGYFSLKDFKDLDDKGASYVSRLKPNVAVYVENKDVEYHKNGQIKKSTLYKRIDLSEIAKDIPAGGVLELKEVYIGRIEKRKERLVIYKLTDKQLKERKLKVEKTAKKKGIKKSENTMKLLGITMFITNIDSSIVPNDQIYEIYSLRWQIEILFKTWKSIFTISNVKPVKIERFKCQLYGKLILLILSSSVMFKMRNELLNIERLEASEIKSAGIIKEYIQKIYFDLVNSPLKEYKILLKIYKCIKRNGRKSHRKGKKTFFDILGVSYHHQENACKFAA